MFIMLFSGDPCAGYASACELCGSTAGLFRCAAGVDVQAGLVLPWSPAGSPKGTLSFTGSPPKKKPFTCGLVSVKNSCNGGAYGVWCPFGVLLCLLCAVWL